MIWMYVKIDIFSTMKLLLKKTTTLYIAFGTEGKNVIIVPQAWSIGLHLKSEGVFYI